MVLVSVYDTKAEIWTRPVVADSKAAAIRDFGVLFNNKDSIYGMHPEDFQLYCLLEFNGNNAGYDFDRELWQEAPQHLANGVDYAQQEKV